ncbi:MAG TPA: phenylalanine--tRNA ligase subunit beta, partial [Dissulfurispiraceae bacterium]|nr:phenylalanine--tRNA ligase subunit beta [Dissulfurispiraceae bacterium]
DVFIESAHFDPASIRRTSKALGLRTESSYRFERGTDIRLLKKALDRAALLMQQVGKGSIHGKIDIYPRRFVPVEIDVRCEKVNRILGLELGRREILRCLEGLGLEIEDLGDHCRVRPPAYRRDMKRDADVIEEVARMYGYDRIPAVLPEATLGIEEPDEGKHGREEVKRRIREALLMAGFTEAVNFSFMGAQDLDFLGIAQDDRRRNLIEVRNPLRMEDAYMRTTLVPALLRNLTHNLAHGNRDLKLFEMARVFFRTEENRLPIEKEHLAMLYYREKIRSLYPEQTQDFFILKGVVEAILADLRITGCTFKRSGEPFLHPGQSADILVQGEKAGFLGVLSPELVEKLDIKAQKPALLVLELDVDALVPYAMQVVQYRQIPKYPFVDRDTAIIVDTPLESAAVMQMLAAYPSDLIEDMTLFDVFQGGSIPAGKKSLAFTVRYRSPERTLTDDEVEVLHNSLVTYILEKTQGQLRQ